MPINSWDEKHGNIQFQIVKVGFSILQTVAVSDSKVHNFLKSHFNIKESTESFSYHLSQGCPWKTRRLVCFAL